MENFLKWHETKKEEVKIVYSLMKKPLSDEPAELIKDLGEIETWNARVGFLLADANGFLDQQSNEARPPKEWGSEADRKALLNASVSPIRVVRDKLEILSSCIKQRLILGESLLAYHRQFLNREIKI